MKKKETLLWKIFRWPVFFLLHLALPIIWICEFFHDVWVHGGKDAFTQFYPHIKRDLKAVKYAWTFSLTGRDRWKEDAEEQRKRFMGAIEEKHSNRKKLGG